MIITSVLITLSSFIEKNVIFKIWNSASQMKHQLYIMGRIHLWPRKPWAQQIPTLLLTCVLQLPTLLVSLTLGTFMMCCWLVWNLQRFIITSMDLLRWDFRIFHRFAGNRVSIFRGNCFWVLYLLFMGTHRYLFWAPKIKLVMGCDFWNETLLK